MIMGQTKRISQLDCATAQAILDHFGITKIRTPQFAEILQISYPRAASILNRLGWQREPIKIGAHWFKDGMDKLFDNNLRVRIRLRAKCLGVILT